MKDHYTIHEIAELYGIGPDSLRYYERLGLIKPKRGENGYRLYSLSDIYRLTIIRDLRQLGFTTEHIREYLNGLSLDNTISMLQDERALIQRRQKELREAERSIARRIRDLNQYRAMQPGEITLIVLPDRPCVRLNTDIARDEEFDFAIKKLHHMHNDTIRDLGSQTMGAALSPKDLDSGRYGLFRSVFFVLPTGAQRYDFLLSGGQYAHLYYRGSYRKCQPQVDQLRRWVVDSGLSESGDILELYHIDNRHTALEDEFLTELQVRLKDDSSSDIY